MGLKLRRQFPFLLFFLIALFISCSSSHNRSDQNNAQSSNVNQNVSIQNASLEDQRAVVAIADLVTRLSGNPSTSSTAFYEGPSLPFVSTAHADAIACSGGGSKYATITSAPDSLSADVQADDSLRLGFNNFSVDMLFDQCKSAISERCIAVYKVDGNLLGTINGTATKRGTNTEYNNIRGHVRSSGTCSGLTIDTSNGLNNPRSAGVDIRSSINGTQTATSSINSLVQHTGTICIGNTTYLINNQDDLQVIKERLCGF